jgi:hypothetical protein
MAGSAHNMLSGDRTQKRSPDSFSERLQKETVVLKSAFVRVLC